MNAAVVSSNIAYAAGIVHVVAAYVLLGLPAACVYQPVNCVVIFCCPQKLLLVSS